jgi:hypothetical protein
MRLPCIKKIAEINDKSLLSAINTIIETNSTSTIFKTSPAQKKKIAAGLADLKAGRFLLMRI